LELDKELIRSRKGSDIGDFHTIKNRPVNKQIYLLLFGNIAAMKRGKINKPEKSEIFPVSALEYSHLSIKSFNSKIESPIIK